MISRRHLIAGMSGGLGISGAQVRTAGEPRVAAASGSAAVPIDFRFSPLRWQTAFCFPDDPHKSLAGNGGELLYGFERGRPNDYFSIVIDFTVRGMSRGRVVKQYLEAPHIPVVHTAMDWGTAQAESVTFATDRAGEGRVDNVLLEFRPSGRQSVRVGPVIRIASRVELAVEKAEFGSLVYAGTGDKKTLLMAIDRRVTLRDDGRGGVLSLPEEEATSAVPLRCFVRLPQNGSAGGAFSAGLGSAQDLLAEARAFWKKWSPCGGDVGWELPRPYQDFLTACARNIQQAREVRNGKLTFQVGPTVYRGLWVVDGNFLLESARYLGYDTEAQSGLEATWSHQEPGGQVSAGAGPEHSKDTAIAMFTMVRQAELSQDWSYFDRMQPALIEAVQCIERLRERARQEDGPNGKYGLLEKGAADGGLWLCAEFTNTLWALAGLKAVAEVPGSAERPAVARAAALYRELRSAFDAAARQEMRRHPQGFNYLPMVFKDDPLWSVKDPWERPNPQTCQWALSQVVYPGILFTPEDPIVRGHVALMQACTEEDVPAETGWIHHGGLWTYNAGFVAHVYLWAGLRDWARRTFHGFLNHATPLYCWREEQPLRGSLISDYVGDMPHNWASAECVLYLRHMLALEDGSALRLLAGIGESELKMKQPFVLRGSPTRFGRVRLALTPQGNRWRLEFERAKGAAPARVEIPGNLAPGLALSGITGANLVKSGVRSFVEPKASSWSAVWG